MSRIKSKHTGIEKLVFRGLRQKSIYFVRHYAGAVGKPDIALPQKKKAVFIDGDFWHGWKLNLWIDKLPAVYWREKIMNNKARDLRNFAKLRRTGWKVLRVWEHQLVEDPDKTIKKIITFLEKR